MPTAAAGGMGAVIPVAVIWRAIYAHVHRASALWRCPQPVLRVPAEPLSGQTVPSALRAAAPGEPLLGVAVVGSWAEVKNQGLVHASHAATIFCSADLTLKIS